MTRTPALRIALVGAGHMGRLHAAKLADLQRAGEPLRIVGVADVKRSGSDVTIVAWSKMVHEALRAAEILEAEGISAEVVDPRTLDPFDWDAVLGSVARTRRCVVAEEGWRRLGVGAEIASRVTEALFHELDAPVQRVGAVDVPLPYARNLESAALPDAQDVVRAVLKIST